jgi:exonuclease III
VSEIQWDVVCLSETWANDGNYTLEGGHRLFCCRDEFRWSGVAILVNARWAPCIIDFCKISDRVAYVDLVLSGTKYRIIAVYVPHAGYHVDYFTVCFDHLRKTLLDGQRKGMKCMLGGDFNTEQNRGWRGN